MSMADVGAGGEEAVVTFETITILTPRYGLYFHVIFILFLKDYNWSFLILQGSIQC